MDEVIERFCRIGELIDRRYQIDGLIGSGATGEVYKARHLEMDKWVAIKFLKIELNPRSSPERFVNEAKIAAKLVHKNIAQIYAIGMYRNRLYQVLEFIDGKTLSAVLKESTRLHPPVALNLLIQVAEAMDYLHQKGVVHRDLKPSNIMIDSEMTPKIIDFGLAKEQRTRQGEDQGQPAPADCVNAPNPSPDTDSLQLAGTPLYMSPEQCMGRSATVQSDIYSFGCLMYECLTGEPPFSGTNAAETMIKQLHNTLPTLPVFCESVLRKCLAKDPSLRYSSFEKLHEDLVQLVPPANINTGQPKKNRSRSQRRIALYAAGSALVSTLACAAYLAITPKLEFPPASEIIDRANREYLKDQKKPLRAAEILKNWLKQARGRSDRTLVYESLISYLQKAGTPQNEVSPLFEELITSSDGSSNAETGAQALFVIASREVKTSMPRFQQLCRLASQATRVQTQQHLYILISRELMNELPTGSSARLTYAFPYLVSLATPMDESKFGWIVHYARISHRQNNVPELRKACSAAVDICERLSLQQNELSHSNLIRELAFFLARLHDQSLDDRFTKLLTRLLQQERDPSRRMLLSNRLAQQHLNAERYKEAAALLESPKLTDLSSQNLHHAEIQVDRLYLRANVHKCSGNYQAMCNDLRTAYGILKSHPPLEDSLVETLGQYAFALSKIKSPQAEPYYREACDRAIHALKNSKTKDLQHTNSHHVLWSADMFARFLREERRNDEALEVCRYGLKEGAIARDTEPGRRLFNLLQELNKQSNRPKTAS